MAKKCPQEAATEIGVLDAGAVIAEGAPASIRSNRAVADAYLGNVHDSTAVTA